MRSLFDTKGHDSKLNARSGQEVEVIRQLGADEVDIPETGLMYSIRFDDGFCTDAFIDELPDVMTKRLCETVFDITTCVLYALTTGESNLGDDSRSVFDQIWEWAKEFEETHPVPEDYLSEVEEFAYGKLRKNKEESK